MVVWPKRFPTVASAEPYARDPEKLANHVYANRLGNGDEASGDGWYFRGRGPIQTTGFDNYKRTGEAIGVDLISAPQKLTVPVIGIAAAGWYWKSNGLNDLADTGNHAMITRRIQGATLGLTERIELTEKIRKIL
jgi:putative chitinase